MILAETLKARAASLREHAEREWDEMVVWLCLALARAYEDAAAQGLHSHIRRPH
jgi:hypothetical protein